MRDFKHMFRDTTKKKHSFLCINYSNDNTHRFLDTEFNRIDTDSYC